MDIQLEKYKLVEWLIQQNSEEVIEKLRKEMFLQMKKLFLRLMKSMACKNGNSLVKTCAYYV